MLLRRQYWHTENPYLQKLEIKGIRTHIIDNHLYPLVNGFLFLCFCTVHCMHFVGTDIGDIPDQIDTFKCIVVYAIIYAGILTAALLFSL